MKEDISVLARNHWPLILVAAGISEDFLTGEHCPCPACGGTDRFRFDDKDGRGTFFCSKCGAGDGFELLRRVRGGPFAEIARFIREEVFKDGPLPAAVVTPKPQQKKDPKIIAAKLLRTWKEAKPVMPGDPVWKYLVETRRLPLTKIPPCIRFHQGMRYAEKRNGKWETVGSFPVMLTALKRGNKGVALHRTYLTPEGLKAPVKEAKKLMETCGASGGAIQLAKAGRRLGIAEGIESAFGAMALYRIPCWATYSAYLMPSVEIPPEVEEVWIFADHDLPDEMGKRAGQDAAAALKERLEGEGKKVRVMLPKKPGTDFHDVFVAKLEQQQAQQDAGMRPAVAKAA